MWRARGGRERRRHNARGDLKSLHQFDAELLAPAKCRKHTKRILCIRKCELPSAAASHAHFSACGHARDSKHTPIDLCVESTTTSSICPHLCPPRKNLYCRSRCMPKARKWQAVSLRIAAQKAMRRQCSIISYHIKQVKSPIAARQSISIKIQDQTKPQ